MDVIFGGQGCPGANRKGGPTNRDVEQAANDCGIAGFLSVAFADIVEHILVELGWSVHRVDYMSWYWGVTKCKL